MPARSSPFPALNLVASFSSKRSLGASQPRAEDFPSHPGAGLLGASAPIAAAAPRKPEVQERGIGGCKSQLNHLLQSLTPTEVTGSLR